MRMLDASFSTEFARKQQDEKGGGVDRDDRKEGMKKEKEKRTRGGGTFINTYGKCCSIYVSA